MYRLNVSIHSSVQNSISYIRVKDIDSGQNANISVEIKSEHPDQIMMNLVSVNDDKYELFMASLVAKDKKDCYSYTITAIDHGLPSRKSEKVRRNILITRIKCHF